MGFLFLAGAIAFEVFGSSMLKVTSISKGKLPIIGIIIAYAISFYLLSLTLLTIPLSFSYAVWSGLGTALTAFIGFIVFKEQWNWKIIASIGLLIFGIILMKI